MKGLGKMFVSHLIFVSLIFILLTSKSWLIYPKKIEVKAFFLLNNIHESMFFDNLNLFLLFVLRI